MADPSRRSLPRATFTSVRPSEADVTSGAVAKRRRGIEKLAYVNALRATPEEIEAARGESSYDPALWSAFDAIAAAAVRTSRSRTMWSAIANVSPEVLATAGRSLAQVRRARRATLATQAQDLIGAHLAFVREEAELVAGRVGGKNPQPPPPHLIPPAALIPPDAIPPLDEPPPENPWKPVPARDPRLTAPALRAKLADAIDWARVSNPVQIDELTLTARKVARVDAALFPGRSGLDWDVFTDVLVSTAEDTVEWTDDLTDGFVERMKAEPVGRVHLERLDMTPVGVTRGELLHAVGLAPRETVTLIHREWSSRETSFEKVVSDEFEQSTEEGVTENTELASATEVQARHSSELSTEVTASASYLFASGSATIGYTSSSEDETAKQDSRNHSVAVTRKASARTRKEHKTTFTIKEQAGVEDQVVRTLTNPSETEPMRIDLHQLLRTWKVDLFRHGLRMTYDLVVPAPGIDLLANLDELRRIEHRLAQPFTFSLLPGAITRASWLQLASQYGATVAAPPPESVLIRQQLNFGQLTQEEANRMRFEVFEFDVPEGFRVQRGELLAIFLLDEWGHFDVYEDGPTAVGREDNANAARSYRSELEQLHGRTGRVSAVMGLYRVRSGYASATLEATPVAETWQAWQHAAWAAMRSAAEEAWQVQRQELARRRDQLGAEIKSWDPLSLRKLEREEIMKTTLKWIFGPAFDLMPSEQAQLYTSNEGGVASIEPSRLTAAEWAQSMGVGEFIKFMQQAIEWENVLFFIYPYFWDHPRNHALKRFLNHPDSLHRAFLRGGAARVVLTVRPGFEESFTRLFETGSLDGELEVDHPYLTIAQEIRAYADTHYPGIPASNADPEALDEAERGVRIGQWNEYTPVSALDISINTPLNQLI